MDLDVFRGEIIARSRYAGICRTTLPLCGIAADKFLKVREVDKLIRLTTQLVGDHRGLGLQRRYDAHSLTSLL